MQIYIVTHREISFKKKIGRKIKRQNKKLKSKLEVIKYTQMIFKVKKLP